jgi:exodeoxyribonuclease VII large subunit
VNEQGYDLFARRERRIYKVGELTRELKGLLEGRFPAIQVEGEISNFRRNTASGHCYFTLKDDGASLRCALFRTQARLIRFQPNDGIHVLVRGRISVYEAGGEYNLIADTMEPLGAGALALRFDELKRKLSAEGLFDANLKRPLPFLPRRIGVVTSPTGAAVQDFLRVLHKRWPDMPVLIAPARVQGDGAAGEICHAIWKLSGVRDVEVIVLARGGGSLEDLWAFNEEAVARAIRRCPVPIVSAVGHEVDFTISDFAADVRAPTPSAAAEMVVRVKAEVRSTLGVTEGRLRRAWDRQIEQRRSRLDGQRRALSDPRRVIGERRIVMDRLLQRAERQIRERLRTGRTTMTSAEAALQRNHPRARLAGLRDALVRHEQRLIRAAQGDLAREGAQLGQLASRLDAMSPLKVLGRGYALAYAKDGSLVRASSDVQAGDRVRVRVSEGGFDATVLGTFDAPSAALEVGEEVRESVEHAPGPGSPRRSG